MRETSIINFNIPTHMKEKAERKMHKEGFNTMAELMRYLVKNFICENRSEN